MLLNFSEKLVNAFWLCVVAALWGITNPFIKQAGKGIETIKKENYISQFFAELKFLFTNWKYIIPFFINQLGSVVFYITLSSAELSLAVPITTSLTFVFTVWVGTWLNEKALNKDLFFGMALVSLGVAICLRGKS